MTASLFFDPAQFGAPSEPEPTQQLIVNGRYMLPPIGDPTGKRRSLQRVTNFIKQLSETGGLERWKLRMAVIGLARDERRYDLATSLDPNTGQGKRDLDKLIEECIDLGQAGPSGGNITGTALHNYTDNKPGEYPIRVRDKWVPLAENYQQALHDKGLRVVPGLSERLVVSERYGTCGRLDDVYEDPFGVLRVGDRKSQKEFQTWWEVGAQLALYQSSDAMWNEQTSSWEDMPKLADDIGHVAWMPLRHPVRRDGVTIYDLPLAGPREILQWCARVRSLRTEARKWGAERLDLDEFARIARDIRDAETHEDLMQLNVGIAAQTTAMPDQLRVMAANRWEELAAEAKPEPVATPLNDTVRVALTSNYKFGTDEQKLTVSGTQYAVEQAAQQLMPQRLNVQGAADAVAVGFDPSLFGAPSQDATFPADQAGVPGGDADAERPGGLDARGPALTGPNGFPTQEAYEDAIQQVAASGAVKPGEGFTVVNDFECRFDGKLASQHPVNVPGQFHCISPVPRPVEAYAVAERVLDAITTPEVKTLEEWDPVRNLPAGAPADAPAQPDQRLNSTHLDSVPIKVVREVCTRANNSQSSRGRVRLLNDLEKKYAAHQEALLPALLAEWLAIDGGPEWDVKLGELVKNTGGSARRAAEKNDAGPITLSQYLAEKDGAPASATEGSAAPAQGGELDTLIAELREEDARAAASIDHSIDPARTEQVAAKIQEFADTVAEIRKPYAGLGSGAHSMLRLIELAKDARNGAERAKVFHEITRRKAWTGEVAAEINQHYLDNGYAIEDFDPYFGAAALPETVEVQVHEEAIRANEARTVLGNGAPVPSLTAVLNGEIAPGQAVAKLRACTKLSELHAAWEALAQLSCWADQQVQEAAFEMLAKIKA